MADVVVEQRLDRPRMSWGGIIGGAITALALWILLYAFGLAVGLTSLNPAHPSSVRGAGIFTGIWALVAPLVALFVGGWVAGHGAPIRGHSEGATHGLIVWGLTTLLGTAMTVMVLSALVGGAVSVGKTVVSTGGSAIGAIATGGGGAASALGIDANDILGPINQRLQAEGKPAVSAEQLQATARDAAQTAVREGRVDRDALVGTIARDTSLSRADAEQLADRVQGQLEQASGQVGQRLHAVAHQVETGALKAGDATGKAFWGVFGALLLGLIAALVGGAAGAPGLPRPPRHERVRATRASAIATPREVHP
jgi:hypothetical protein